MEKIRIYDIDINENDETGVDINSFVESPAHMRNFETYSKDKKILFGIDEEKRIVTGVFIMADFLIYRNDKRLGEHYVKFSQDVVWRIRNKFFKKGFHNNTNVEHTFMVDGATLVESYIVHSKDPRFPKPPEILSKQKVNDGSWIGSYHIENDDLWNDCKNGVFKGFSVEGYFEKVPVKIKSNKSHSMKNNKSGFSSFMKKYFSDESDREEMAEVTTVDGIVLFYEGELKEGTVVMIETDGQKIAATGDHQLEIDGVLWAITLDDSGKVITMEQVEQMSEMEEEMQMMAKVLRKMEAQFEDRFKKLEKENSDLKSQVEALEKGEKYSKDGKKSPGKKSGYKSILGQG